jgi:hypothetical protein
MDGIGDFDLGGFPTGFRAYDTLSARGLGPDMGRPLWDPPFAILSDTMVDLTAEIVAFNVLTTSDAPAPGVEGDLAMSFETGEAVVALTGVAEERLFTAFNWPEQTLLAFDDDDGFVAPKRFGGRAGASWL